MKHAVIVSGGEIDDAFTSRWLKEAKPDCLIAADSGLEFFYRNRIQPHIVIGDFDSAAGDIEKYYLADRDVRMIRLNPVKDDTDTEAAVRYAVSNRAECITVFGATGTRLDHVLGNISLLFIGIQEKIPITILDAHNRIRMLEKGIVMEKLQQYGNYISLIPYMGDVTGLTLRGMKYPLTDYTLTGGNSLGISNEIEAERAEITFRSGVLLMIETKD